MHNLPNRNGDVYQGVAYLMRMFNGYRVQLSDLTTTKIHLQERKWSRRKMWQKDRRFNHIPYQVPSREIIKTETSLCMHPAMWKEIEYMLAKQPTYSMGMAHHALEPTLPQNN